MITIRFLSPVSNARREAFLSAARRWDETVDTSFPSVDVEDETLDGLLIEASIETIDGEQGVLGQAGPTFLLNESELPAKGVMQFDVADVERLEQENSFSDVVIHEMAHVMGFGTLWDRFGLILASGTNNPEFSGMESMAEYALLLAVEDPLPIPVANTGGPGTREGHWRELVFGDELMTGFLSGQSRSLSRMTIASFKDMGYQVDYTKADEYGLPTFLELAQKGITEAVRTCDLCRMQRTNPVVLP